MSGGVLGPGSDPTVGPLGLERDVGEEWPHFRVLSLSIYFLTV